MSTINNQHFEQIHQIASGIYSGCFFSNGGKKGVEILPGCHFENCTFDCGEIVIDNYDALNFQLINCDINGSISIMVTENDHLNALLDSDSFPLSKVQELNLFRTNMPTGIERLENLEALCISGDIKYPTGAINLSKLRVLKFVECSDMTQLPDLVCGFQSLETLKIECLEQLTSLHDNIGLLSNLRVLDLYMCDRLEALPESFYQLKHLKQLMLIGCGKLRLTNDIHNLTRSGDFTVSGDEYVLKTLASLNALSCLHELGLFSDDLTPSELCKYAPDLICLEELIIAEMPPGMYEAISKIRSIKSLTMSLSRKDKSLPESLFHMTQLERLGLYGCGSLEVLPDALSVFTSLKYLLLKTSRQIKTLPSCISQLTNIETIYVDNFRQLREVDESIARLPHLTSFEINKCPSLNTLPQAFDSLKKSGVLKHNN